jgi:hypothetical protein
MKEFNWQECWEAIQACPGYTRKYRSNRKTILLATSNKDKFKIVKYFLQKAGLEESEYQILSLKDINYCGPDEKEQGSIDQRAKAKAISVANNVSNRNDYDFIIGIDDGIELKGSLRENVKDYIKDNPDFAKEIENKIRANFSQAFESALGEPEEDPEQEVEPEDEPEEETAKKKTKK